MKNTMNTGKNTIHVGNWDIHLDIVLTEGRGRGRSKFSELWKSMPIGRGGVFMTDTDRQSLYNMVGKNGGKMRTRTRDDNGKSFPDGKVCVMKIQECSNTKWFA